MKDPVEIITKIIESKTPVQTVTAKVLTVDEQKMVCEVEVLDGAQREGVRLRSAIKSGDDTGVIIVPKVDSYVLVGLIYNLKEQSFIMKCSEVDKVLIKIGGTTFELNADDLKLDVSQTTFNGGNNGGLIKIDPFVTAYNANLTAIKAAVAAGFAAVDTALNGIAPGSGASSAAFNASANSVQSLQKNSIENPKIKH